MQNQENRVLSRTGARELTTEEVEYATGGAARINTQFCTAMHTLGRFDGDGCGDHN